MNILILSWRGPAHPEAGGAEVSTHEHVKAWVNAGHVVWLFTSSFEGGKKKEVINGVNIIRMGGDVFVVQILAFFWYLFGKHPRFDLVIDEFHGIPFFTPVYVRVKKLAFIHEVAKEVWWFNPWPKPFNLIPALIGTVFERFIFSFLYKKTTFMTVSESTKKELVVWGIPEQNITVIYNGVTVVKLRPLKKEKTVTAMYLGALSRDKGIEDAIKVFGLINQTNPSWQFWIVGKGESNYLEKLKGTISLEGLVDSIRFWGYVSEPKKFELLSRAHILLNPSIREGWGLVNIEANRVGTPVIGYKVPGMVDSVVDGVTGRLVETGNINAFTQVTIEMLSDKSKYLRTQKKAQEWSRNFSWSKSTNQSLELINSLL